jgi:arylsulfatase A-like enzyme
MYADGTDTVDALRAGYLSQYGYHRDTMPVLDQLTETGTVFESAYVSAPYTRVSIPSFHTPHYLVYERLESFPTIAAILSDRGVRTVVIGIQTGIDLVYGDFRFDEMRDLGRDAYYEEANASRPLSERVPARVNDVATPILRRQRATNDEVTGDHPKRSATWHSGSDRESATALLSRRCRYWRSVTKEKRSRMRTNARPGEPG